MSVAFHPATASRETSFSASFAAPRCSVPVTAVGGVSRVPFGVHVRFLFVEPRSYNSDPSSFFRGETFGAERYVSRDRRTFVDARLRRSTRRETSRNVTSDDRGVSRE